MLNSSAHIEFKMINSTLVSGVKSANALDYQPFTHELKVKVKEEFLDGPTSPCLGNNGSPNTGNLTPGDKETADPLVTSSLEPAQADTTHTPTDTAVSYKISNSPLHGGFNGRGPRQHFWEDQF